ncbi:glutaredoxin family protein [Marinobacterium arenosum]|uniref:glutaredoxin family protein n=1 Tax=Marinobacterium arenosum TaxID=2862496 RepID=UPI001C954E9F|nr:glutaredoxin family protein [Marinobacterium arenosum]MBY4676922.1 glutaredoxin family protein [Marinobacterium arenosum]
MKKLVLMTTLGCHLCELAEAVLIETLHADDVIVEAQDIADDELLVKRYGVRIPVLLHESSGAELGWPFDAGQLREFVDGLPG